jgi:hypothetical protein
MRSSKLCGRFWSKDFLDSALLVEEAGDRGDAIVEAMVGQKAGGSADSRAIKQA